MMKVGLRLVPLLVVLVVACAEDRRDAASPTEPPAAAVSAAETPPPTPEMAGATVCLSYGRDRELVRARLKAAPSDAKLQDDYRALDALILDAC